MMAFLTDFLLPCVYAVLACLASCVILGRRGPLMLISSLGGGLGWAVCLLCTFTGSDIVQYFFGAVAVALYAEAMARICKAPVTGFLVVGILPFVPGGGIYYTMDYCLSGDTQQFLSTGIHTFGIAGAVAVGLLLASSLVHLFLSILQRKAARL